MKHIAIKFIEDLINSDPAKAADIFENMEIKESINLFRKLSTENQAKCIKNFNPKFSAKVITRLSSESIKTILSRLDKYKIVSILRNSHESKLKSIINELDNDTKSSIYYLFDYPKNSAARIMFPDFISLKRDITVRDAVNKLRILSKLGEIKSYVYVIDDHNNICGVLNTRDLVISEDDKKIEEIMIKNIVKVSPYNKKEELVEIFANHNFISLPVVDGSGKILGIVESKSVIESAREESMEDMQLLLGADPDEKMDSPISFKIKNRLKWLMINLATVFMSAAVVAYFESTIAMITALAIIMPMIPGQGAAAGAQTLSVIIRSIVMGEIDFKDVRKIISMEIFIGLVNGFICGILTGIIFFIWKENYLLGLVVFLAMTINMVIAGVSGALIPIIMRRLNLDPAHSSIVILTTVTDIAGLFLLLMLGKIIIA